MLLKISASEHAGMSEAWKQQFAKWMELLGFDVNNIAWVECCPEAKVLWVFEHKMHPETGRPYIGSGGEIASETSVFFYDKHPTKIFFYTWERAMIAYQGDQGA